MNSLVRLANLWSSKKKLNSSVSVVLIVLRRTKRESNGKFFANEYMKDHIFELRRKIRIYDRSLQLCRQLKQL